MIRHPVRPPWALCVLLTATLGGACAPGDRDGDGLSDGQERRLGSDPDNPDSDGDLLDDGEEVDLGTDPLTADHDRDGYLDGWEVLEGTDPLDPDSRIYEGGWPYRPFKDDLASVDWEGSRREVGAAAPRFQLVDQHGQIVDLYDFYNEDDKYVLVDLSASWCPPCQGVARWMAGTSASQADYDEAYPGLREHVLDGEMYWVTVLGEDLDREEPSVEDIQAWETDHPNAHIPVLGGEGVSSAVGYLINGGWPSFALFGPDLTLVSDGRVLQEASAIAVKQRAERSGR